MSTNLTLGPDEINTFHASGFKDTRPHLLITFSTMKWVSFALSSFDYSFFKFVANNFSRDTDTRSAFNMIGIQRTCAVENIILAGFVKKKFKCCVLKTICICVTHSYATGFIY